MESPSPAVPVAVTCDPELADHLHRLSAAAGVPLKVVAGVEGIRGSLSAFAGLVVDPAASDVATLVGPGERPRTVVVTNRIPDVAQWQLAVSLRAEQVAHLPTDQTWLMEWLVDVTDGSRAATTVGLVGGRGGAGASTLAVALARTAVRHHGAHALLVDVDELGGGLDLLAGCEDAPGLRWPDVASTRGRVNAAALRDALPHDEGVAVLSWTLVDHADVSTTSVNDVLQAAKRGADLVVIDLPRYRNAAAAGALALVDTLLVVATADVRGAAAASRVLAAARGPCGDIRAVVRTGPGACVEPEAVAESLGLPLAGQVPTLRGLERAVSEGLGPPATGRLGRACRRLLDELVPGRWAR